MKRFLRGLGNPNPCFLLMGMLVLSLGLSRLSPYFWTGRNIANIIDQASVGIILSMGMTFVVAAAGIDLSIGANIALSSLVAALFLKQGFGCLPSVFAGLLLASMSGVLNGSLISFLHLNPFIVTLCTMSVFRGAALLLTDGRPVFGFPESFMSLGSVLPGGVSVPALTALSVAGLSMFLMRFTKFGAYACFMGCNEEALSRSGVNCHRWKLAFYAVSGLCSGIAGLILCARLNTAEPLSAVGIEMDVIAAVVLGGTDIRGGRGSAVGSLLACLFLALLRNGFVIVNVSARYQQLLMGLIVLVAVSVSEMRHGRRA